MYFFVDLWLLYIYICVFVVLICISVFGLVKLSLFLYNYWFIDNNFEYYII